MSGNGRGRCEPGRFAVRSRAGCSRVHYVAGWVGGGPFGPGSLPQPVIRAYHNRGAKQGNIVRSCGGGGRRTSNIQRRTSNFEPANRPLYRYLYQSAFVVHGGSPGSRFSARSWTFDVRGWASAHVRPALLQTNIQHATPNVELRTTRPGALPFSLLSRLDATDKNTDQLVGFLHQWIH